MRTKYITGIRNLSLLGILFYDEIYPKRLTSRDHNGSELSLDICDQDSDEVQLTFPAGVVRHLLPLRFSQLRHFSADEPQPPSLFPLPLHTWSGQTSGSLLHHIQTLVEPPAEADCHILWRRCGSSVLLSCLSQQWRDGDQGLVPLLLLRLQQRQP